MSYTAPQYAKVTSTSSITWSNGALFSGYLLFGLALPTDALGGQWAELRLYGTTQRLPVFTRIPIIEGQIDQNSAIFLTSQLDPPNTRYVLYWYDNTDKLIYPFPSGTLPTSFSVTTQPYVVTQPTLTAPVVPTVIQFPAPEAPLDPETNPMTYAIPVEYFLSGTADGSNAAFTIPVTPIIFCAVFIDGQKQDPTSYLRSGALVTFTSAPTSGSSVTALVI